MVLFRVQVEIPYDTGLPEDKAVNVWWFDCTGFTPPDPVPSGLLDAITSLQTFYGAIGSRYSQLINASATRLKAYNWTDPEPRAPVIDDQSPAMTSGGAGLPPEMCVCLSFQGERVSGQDQKRRRGRVYLGPLIQSFIDSNGRTATASMSSIRSAAEDLLGDSKAASDWKWVVYSRVDEEAVVVDNGWIDDELDTQRRRGFKPTARVTFV